MFGGYPPPGQLLDHPHRGNQFQGLVQNSAHAYSLMAQRSLRVPVEFPSTLEGDFPYGDDDKQKALVGQIFLAIRSMSGIYDWKFKRNKNGDFIPEPDLNAIAIIELTDIHVELLAWQILVSNYPASLGYSPCIFPRS